MARQESKRKVDSQAVQGKGSWVEFKPMTWGEAEELQVERDAHAGDSQWINDRTKQLYADHILDWNWADGEGNPIEIPSKDPEVLKLLTIDEVDFIDTLFEVKRDPKK